MRLATWNVNSIRSRVDRVTDWLARTDVDVLAMQETKARDDQFPHAAFEEMGYEVAHHGLVHAAPLVHDERASLEAFRGVPTTVLVGTRDRLTPASWGQRLAQSIPGAELVVLPGLGHMLPYEATAEVVDALLSPVRHPA